jgi:uncharacterized membrane protein (DUF106 family)
MPTALQLLATAGTNPDLLLTNLLLPFILIFAILWGLLSTVRLFGDQSHKINLIIALVFTIAISLTDAWGFIATQLAIFSGVFTYIMFFAVFILVVILWAIGRTRTTLYEHVYAGGKIQYRNLKELDKHMAKIAREIQQAEYRGDKAKAAVLTQTYSELEKKKEMILKQAQILGK